MIPTRFLTAADGIARELDLLAAGQPAVLVWQAMMPAIVVPEPLARRAGVKAITPTLNADGWPILTRSSGGGAVPQGLGTLNLAVVLPLVPGFKIEDGYVLLGGMLADPLARFTITADSGAVDGAFCDGAWNVTVGGRKLAGTAQRWRGRTAAGTALLHAALQIDPLPGTVWPALATLHAAAGLPGSPQPDAHITLTDLIAEPRQRTAFPCELARTANDHLSRFMAARRRAA